MRLRPSVFALAVPLLLAACAGEGGLNEEEQAFADVWAASLEDEEDGFGVARQDAKCMAEAIMTELGTEPFDKADVTPDDIADAGEDNNPGVLLGEGAVSEEQANVILDDWDACVDLAATLAESAAEEFDLDDDGADCLTEAFGEGDLIRDLMVSSFTSDDEAPDDDTVSELIGLVESCGGDDGRSPLVDEIAAGMMEDSDLTEDEALCLAQALLDDVGAARLAELGASGDFSGASPDDQQEMAEAIIAAAGECDVPISAFGG